jgi:hypothetical protein
LDSFAEYSTAIISGIDQDQIKRRSVNNEGYLGRPKEQVCYDEL